MYNICNLWGDGMEYLFSIFWKNIRIGFCFKAKNKYVFLYDKEGIKETSKFGFNKIIGFPDIEDVYINNQLFPVFETRIISSKRYKLLNKEDKIKYLIHTKGKLTTDNITIDKEDLENVKTFFQKRSSL